MAFVRTEKSVKVIMYTGGDDPDLPSHVASLPLNMRVRWADNYNWAIQETLDNKKAIERADMYTSMSIADLIASGILKEMAQSEVAAVMARSSAVGVPVVGEGVQPPSFLQKIKALLGGSPTEATLPTPTTFTIYKSGDGRLRTLIVYSNIFKDHEKEIISAAAHQEYADAAEAGEPDAPYPDLHLWHGGPATKWGTVETVSFVGGFAVAGGVVDQDERSEAVALKLKEIADRGELAVSFGLVGLRGPDGVYHLYRPFEISPLPAGSEANPWFTSVDFNLKENGMAFSDKKKAWYKEHFKYTDEQITAAEKQFEAMGDALKPFVEFRNRTSGASGETPAPVPQPTPTPPDPAPTPPPPSPSPPSSAAPVAVAATVGAATADGDTMPEMLQMAKGLTELTAVVKSLADDLATLRAGAPAAAAAAADDLVLAQIAKAPGGFSPTQSAGNVNKEFKENEDDFLANAFKGIGLSNIPFGTVVTAAPSPVGAAAAGAEGK